MNKNIPTPLVILVIVLILAVIIGISFWLCPKKETVSPQDETTDWQIYRNTKQGVEFKYPEQLVITGPDDEFLYEDVNSICLQPEEERDAPYLFCSIALDIYCDSLQNIISDFQSRTDDFHQETIKVNNITAIKMTGRIKDIDEPIDEQLKEILVGQEKADVYIPYNNDVYCFYYSGINGDFKKEFNQILSTFKFIQSEELMSCEKWLDLKCENAQSLIEEAEGKMKEVEEINEEYDPEREKNNLELISRLQSLLATITSLTNKAVKLCPGNADFWFRRGNIYFEFGVISGAREVALESYQKAHELDSDNHLYLQKIKELTE